VLRALRTLSPIPTTKIHTIILDHLNLEHNALHTLRIPSQFQIDLALEERVKSKAGPQRLGEAPMIQHLD
jgi:hypothetical protein